MNIITRLSTTLSQLLRISAVRDFNVTFILRIFFIGSTFVTRILLAQLLGSSGLGVYDYALAWIDILLIVAVLGIDRLLVREVATAQAKDDWGTVAGLLRFATRIPLVLITIVVLIASVGQAYLLQLDPQALSPAIAGAMALALLLLPIRALIRIRQGIMQGFGNVQLSHLPEYLIQPIVFIGAVLLLWVLAAPLLTFASALLLVILSTIISWVVGEVLHRRTLPAKVQSSTPQMQTASWLWQSLLLLFINGMIILMNRVDVLMLGVVLDADSVAIYSTAVQLASLVVVLHSTANTILAPRFARFFQQENMAALQNLLIRSTQLVFVVAFLGGIVLILFGEPLLAIFGAEFVAGNQALQIMIVGQWINAATGSVAMILIMTNYSRDVAWGMFAATVLNVLFNLWLIPLQGIEGAAIATTITMTLLNILMVVLVWKRLKIRSSVLGGFFK